MRDEMYREPTLSIVCAFPHSNVDVPIRISTSGECSTRYRINYAIRRLPFCFWNTLGIQRDSTQQTPHPAGSEPRETTWWGAPGPVRNNTRVKTRQDTPHPHPSEETRRESAPSRSHVGDLLTLRDASGFHVGDDGRLEALEHARGRPAEGRVRRGRGRG